MRRLAWREGVAAVCVAAVVILVAQCFVRESIIVLGAVACGVLLRCLAARAPAPVPRGEDAPATGSPPDLRCGDIVIDSRTGTSSARRMSLVLSAWRDPRTRATYTLNYEATRDAAGERLHGWRAVAATSQSPFQNLDVVRFRHATASFRDELRRRARRSEPGEVLDIVRAALRRVGDPNAYLNEEDDDREAWIRNTSHWERVATERDVFLARQAALPARVESWLRDRHG